MRTTQYTLDMRPAEAVPKKGGPRNRLYLLPPDAIVMVDYLAMVSGRSKPEIVADAIRIATILRRYIPKEGLERVLEERTEEAVRGMLSQEGGCDGPGGV